MDRCWNLASIYSPRATRGSDALKALVARWLQKDPAGRPAPDALAWKADLERAAGY